MIKVTIVDLCKRELDIYLFFFVNLSFILSKEIKNIKSNLEARFLCKNN